MKVLGHKNQKEFLKRLKEKESVPHALLFTGPEKIGKRRVALEFIKTLNPSNKSEIIEKREYPDFFSIEQEEEIQINQIRDLQKGISLTGQTKDSFKAVLIDRAHLMNSQAQSALLKTLEEPKGRVVIILITEYPEMLLSTILSRVWTLSFSPLKEKEIEDFLVNLGAKKEKAKEISIISLGKPGLALDLFQNPKLKDNLEKKKKEFLIFLEKDIAFQMDYLKKIAEKEDIKETLKIWNFVLREKMIKEKEEGEVSLKTKKMVENVQEVLYLISNTNVNKRLFLEKIILNI